MENKINIAELLKDCPKGTKLYSSIFGDVDLEKIRPHLAVVVTTKSNDKEEFLYDGRYGISGECVLFPSKENRDWSTFQRPFKDGDIVTWEDRGSLVACVYKERKNTTTFNHHIALYSGGLGIVVNGEIALTNNELCLATEEEKQKLFDAIKENGYKWDPETKTLEKLIEAKFKVGDRIKHKLTRDVYRVLFVQTNVYSGGVYYHVGVTDKIVKTIDIEEQDSYELVPNKFDITTLKPFESRVLMRSSNAREWTGTIFSHYSNNKFYGCGMCCEQCIPYEGNEYLLGTTNDCDEYYKTWEE